jgi:hypothetical protein
MRPAKPRKLAKPRKPVKPGKKDGEPMSAPPSGVKVRMYRQGLGDCFLLALATGENEKRPFYVLIDCGLIVGTPDAPRKMQEVATDLRKATGGRIDVLVATNPHWDHLSGFEQAKEIFRLIRFGEVWVAWTEDPSDLLAARLRAKRETALRGLHAAAQGLRAAAGDQPTSRLDPVLGFFGELGADGRPSGLQSALEFVLSRGNARYHTPGRPPLSLPGGARVYVLGPPRNEKLLLRSDPSRRASEIYDKKLGLDEETAFFAAAMATVPGTGLALTEEEEELRAMSVPFDRPCGLTFDKAQKDGFFQQRYFGVPGKLKEKDKDKDIFWRRIDDSWLGVAEKLALQLDADTNNTSLALAIELSPGGKVLLFPGDAQVGNWLSWESLSWPREGKADDPVTAADLLRRTVLYKVGHYGSHNATLRAKGLELMESPDLVAMIPVDEEMARQVKGWDMPFGELLKRLQEKTSGRILRADAGLPEKPPQVTAEDWQEFLDGCAQTDLYVEIIIPS